MQKNGNLSYKLIYIIILLLVTSFSQCSNDYDFSKLKNILKKMDLIFVVPKEAKFVPIINNKQVRYDLAYQLDNGMEIRYTFWPLDSDDIYEYKEYLEIEKNGLQHKDSSGNPIEKALVNPNDIHKGIFFSTLFNICEKTDSSWNSALKNYKEWPNDWVKHDFNADYGATTACYLDKEFGQNYKICSIYIFQKKDFGFVICYRLFKDLEHNNRLTSNKEFNKYLYNIQFYKPVPPYLHHPEGKPRIYRE